MIAGPKHPLFLSLSLSDGLRRTVCSLFAKFHPELSLYLSPVLRGRSEANWSDGGNFLPNFFLGRASSLCSFGDATGQWGHPSLFISHLLPLQCIVAEEEDDDDDEEEIRFSPGGKEKAAAALTLSLSLLFAYSTHARVAKAQLPSEKVVVCPLPLLLFPRGSTGRLA